LAISLSFIILANLAAFFAFFSFYFFSLRSSLSFLMTFELGDGLSALGGFASFLFNFLAMPPDDGSGLFSTTGSGLSLLFDLLVV
jgi:hypothetical protein